MRVLPLVLFASLPIVASAAPPPKATVTVYLRKAGATMSRHAGVKDNPKVYDLDTLPLEEVKHVDVQYEGAFRYRGIRLGALIAKYGAPAGVDLAILHFDNGMAVPLPFRDDKAMKRLDPLLARELKRDDGKSGEGFPTVSRKAENFVDIKPIHFESNKLVVAERWHPALPEGASAAFSPWMYVDSLAEIELVRSAAYYKSLDVEPSGDAHAGFVVYQQSCQFCHGARKLGGSFGWDFVEPEPVTVRKRSPGSLFFHVHYRAASEQARGAMMPALSHVTEADAAKLFAWLRVLADKPISPYAP